MKMNPDEIEFLAEKLEVSIIPTFNHGVIHLICGDVGPFRASLPIRVPLYVAMTLKQQRKCKIQPPDWMDVDKLEVIREDEKNSATFTKMPSEHYMVEVKILLSCATDDIVRSEELRTIVKDIWDIRMSKIRSSVDTLIKNGGAYATIDNLTLMEINSMRPLLTHAMDQLYRMKKNAVTTGTQTQNTLSMLNASTSSALSHSLLN